MRRFCTHSPSMSSAATVRCATPARCNTVQRQIFNQPASDTEIQTDMKGGEGSTPRYLGRSGPYHAPAELELVAAFLVAFFACFTVRRIVVRLCGPTAGGGRQERYILGSGTSQES